jgi:hypothetical protein
MFWLRPQGHPQIHFKDAETAMTNHENLVQA